MNKETKFISVGNSTGVLIPRDLLTASGFELGEEIVIKASPGRLQIEPKSDNFERQMEIARDVMRRRRQALRELAK